MEHRVRNACKITGSPEIGFGTGRRGSDWKRVSGGVEGTGVWAAQWGLADVEIAG